MALPELALPLDELPPEEPPPEEPDLRKPFRLTELRLDEPEFDRPPAPLTEPAGRPSSPKARRTAPLRAVLDEARQEVGRFVEVYVDCPLDVCKERDVRGLYIMAERGQVKSLPGVGDPFEMPESAEITVHTGQESPEQCVAAIVRGLEGLGYVQGSASQ